MRRLLMFLLVCLILCMLGITACAPQATPQLTSVPSTKPAVTSTPAAETPQPIATSWDLGVDIAELNQLQIHFMHPWSGETLEELVKMVDEFNQTNEWGIHVIMDTPGSAAMVTSKTWEGIANQQQPNVLTAPISFLLSVDEKTGLVVDENTYLNSSDFGLLDIEIDRFTPIFWNEDLVEGKRLGIPAQRSALFLAYNMTWAKELGFTSLPGTPEEFRTQVCAANASFRKNDDPMDDGLGGWLINVDPAAVLSWFLGFGAEPYMGNGYQFSGEPGEETFQYLLGLKKDACAWTGKPNKDLEYFTNRQTLAVALWMQDFSTLDKAFKRINSEDEWTVIPFPGKKDQTLITGGPSYAILHTDQAKDLAAWLFIRWLTAPKQQARLLPHLATLPLTGEVENLMGTFNPLPQWKTAGQNKEIFTLQPVDADWQVINPVLEDAAWQLLKTEVTEDQIPGLLAEMDALAIELAKRNP